MGEVVASISLIYNPNLVTKLRRALATNTFMKPRWSRRILYRAWHLKARPTDLPAHEPRVAMSVFALSPREERAGREPERGAIQKVIPPLPVPLLPPASGREGDKSGRFRGSGAQGARKVRGVLSSEERAGVRWKESSVRSNAQSSRRSRQLAHLTQTLPNRRFPCLGAQSLHLRCATLNLRIHLRLVIVVVAQRGVNLRQR
jgi:hypothetical protein